MLTHFDINEDEEQKALDNEVFDGDADEDNNGVWDISMENTSPGVRMEPEEIQMVEEVENGGPITRVRLPFS